MYVLDINQFSRFTEYIFMKHLRRINFRNQIEYKNSYLLIFFYLLRYKQFNFIFDKTR